MLTEFSNDITLNEHLFKRVKFVYDAKNKLQLSTEQSTLLTKKYKASSINVTPKKNVTLKISFEGFGIVKKYFKTF